MNPKYPKSIVFMKVGFHLNESLEEIINRKKQEEKMSGIFFWGYGGTLLHPYKKRHLIAHGLAHHLFHRKRRVNYFLDYTKDFLKSLDVKRQEREAEVFAAYFLIPEEKLDAILKQEWIKDSPDPIPELAEEFQVSENL